MIYNKGRKFYFVVIIFLFFLSSFFKIYLINKERNRVSQHWSLQTITEKKIGFKKFLGFKNIAADIYWVYLLQLDYLGSKLSGDFVYTVADLITSLDKHFNVVYRFAATGLSFGLQRPDLAHRLLQKALTSSFNKDDWRIYFQLGYDSSFYYNDKQKAAYYIAMACRQPKKFDSYLKVERTAPPHYLTRWKETLQATFCTRFLQ